MLRTIVTHNDGGGEYFFAEGCFITEWWNVPDDPLVSVARARVEPGVMTHWHRLSGVVERYVILEGEGLAEIGDATAQRVTPGSIVLIPAGVLQRITNTGTRDLVFLAVCTPRFQLEHYRDNEADGESG